MLLAVKGYYDGEQIVVDEDDRKNLKVGDEVIITILNGAKEKKAESRLERRKKIIDSGVYVTDTGRSVEEVDGYVKELRTDERF